MSNQELLQATISVLIALIGIYIAYRQYKVDKDNVKHALYEKRYSIYIKARQFLLSGMEDVVESDKFREFDIYLGESKFLFKPEIFEFLNGIYMKVRLYSECLEKKNREDYILSDILDRYLSELGYTDLTLQKDYIAIEDDIFMSLTMDLNKLNLMFEKYLSFKSY
jgi:hypothetical protein